jgi:hypothetical protein
VPPVCTSIQLIITINVLTARGKNIGYLKGSLESQLNKNAVKRKLDTKRVYFSYNLVTYSRFRATLLLFQVHIHSRSHRNFTLGTFFRLAKVTLKTVFSVLKRTFICNEYVLYYAVRSTSVTLGDNY